MRNKIILSAIAVLATSTASYAGDNYFGLSASANKLNDVDVKAPPFGTIATTEYKTGYGFNTEIGTKLTEGLRAELEYSYRHHKIDKINGAPFSANQESHAIMANAYYDIGTGTAISPYIGGGIGYGGLKDHSDFYDGFAYQGMAGLNYRIRNDLVAYTGYKYFSIVNPKDKGIEINYDTHNVEAGLRFEFGGDSKSSSASNSYNTVSGSAPVAYSAPQPVAYQQPAQVAPVAQANNAPMTFTVPSSQQAAPAAAAPESYNTANNGYGLPGYRGETVSVAVPNVYPYNAGHSGSLAR